MADNPFAKYRGGSKSAYEEVASEQSPLQNFIQGVGGGMYGLYLGGKQMAGQADQKEVDDYKRAMKGLESTTSGTAGNITGKIAATVPAMFIPGANTVAGGAALGGVTGALEPTAKDESRLTNIGLGMAGGGLGTYAGNKIAGALVGRRGAQQAAEATATATPGTASAESIASGSATATGKGGGYTFGSVGKDPSAGLTESQKGILQRINDSEFMQSLGGMRLTPGQASGSKALQQMEAKLESQPMTSGTFNEIKAHNQRTLNRAVAGSLGEAADVVDSAVLENAHSRISDVYKMVADKRPRAIDPDTFLGGLSKLEGDFEGLLFANGKPYSVMDHPLVSRLFNYAEKGAATGEQLQDVASKLGNAARNQMKGNGDRELGRALFQAKEMADDLLSQGLNGDTKKAFDTARGQYRNLMTITERQGIVNPSNGNISGPNLANALQAKDRHGFLFGKNQSPLYDAARFSQAFKPIVGDSGTATRSALPSPTDFVLSLPFNLATKAYTSSPAINLAARASNIRANGLMPNLNPSRLRGLPMFMGQAGAQGLGLLNSP